MGDSIDWDSLLPTHTSNYVGAVLLDGELRVRAVDDAVVARNGFTKQKVLSMTALDVVHPDDLAEAAAGLMATRSIEGARLPGLYRLLFADGDFDSFEVRTVSLDSHQPGAVAIQIFDAGDEFKTAMFADQTVKLMTILVEPGSTTDLLNQVAGFAQRHVREMTMAITVFEPDGSTTTTERPDLPVEVVAENRAAHPLSLPPHVGRATWTRSPGPTTPSAMPPATKPWSVWPNN